MSVVSKVTSVSSDGTSSIDQVGEKYSVTSSPYWSTICVTLSFADSPIFITFGYSTVGIKFAKSLIFTSNSPFLSADTLLTAETVTVPAAAVSSTESTPFWSIETPAISETDQVNVSPSTGIAGDTLYVLVTVFPAILANSVSPAILTKFSSGL